MPTVVFMACANGEVGFYIAVQRRAISPSYSRCYDADPASSWYPPLHAHDDWRRNVATGASPRRCIRMSGPAPHPAWTWWLGLAQRCGRACRNSPQWWCWTNTTTSCRKSVRPPGMPARWQSNVRRGPRRRASWCRPFLPLLPVSGPVIACIRPTMPPGGRSSTSWTEHVMSDGQDRSSPPNSCTSCGTPASEWCACSMSRVGHGSWHAIRVVP